ncbi:AMP-binding protein [Bacillus cereus]
MFSQFVDLLEQLVKQSDSNIFADERIGSKPLIKQYNENNRKNTFNYSVSIIYRPSKRTPDEVAVVFEQEWLTYSELHKRSNQIAHFLKEQGIGLG